jgi:hypothetical protein
VILGVPSVASAAAMARISSFKAKAEPIPKPGGGTFPHTGNILGAPAAVQAEYTITGSGYGVTTQNPAGGIPPISHVNSVASPVGHALGEVTFGTERVPEEAELRAFFGPGGGLLFYVAGHSPVSLEFVSSGNYV